MATSTLTQDSRALLARKEELWAALADVYRALGDDHHLEHLRNIDKAFYEERRRVGSIEALMAERFERETAEVQRRRTETDARVQKAKEDRKAHQRELDRDAAKSWADHHKFSGTERSELLAAVEAGEDVLQAVVRIQNRRGTFEDRLAALEERTKA